MFTKLPTSMSSNYRFQPFADKYDPIAVASIDCQDKQPHDNAVVRAINSQYVPNVKLPGNPLNTLFVGRLHPKVTGTELEAIFKVYGEVKSCKVIHDLVTGFSKQYGFVEFADRRQAQLAHKKAHRMIVRGAEIVVDWETGRVMEGWKPRSLGGGFGGRKESGQLRFGCRIRSWKEPIIIPSVGSKEPHWRDSTHRTRRRN